MTPGQWLGGTGLSSRLSVEFQGKGLVVMGVNPSVVGLPTEDVVGSIADRSVRMDVISFDYCCCGPAIEEKGPTDRATNDRPTDQPTDQSTTPQTDC